MARRTAALVGAVRPTLPASMYPAPDTPSWDDADNPAPLPAPALSRDGASRLGGVAAMDSQNRVSILKAASCLGWYDATLLVVTCELGRLTVAQGSPQRRREAVATYKGGRLTLSRAARGCLGVASGDQVVVCAAAGRGAMVLMAGADVFQILDGPASATPAA
jgi:hypothetical protein